MSSILTKFLKNKIPNYDENRYYWGEGDVVITNTNAKLLVIGNGITKVRCLVLSSGFGYKKGETLFVSMNSLPKILKSEYNSSEYKKYDIKRGLRWESGDIVEREGDVIAITSKNENNSFYGYMLQGRNSKVNSTYQYSSISLSNPFENYF